MTARNVGSNSPNDRSDMQENRNLQALTWSLREPLKFVFLKTLLLEDSGILRLVRR